MARIMNEMQYDAIMKRVDELMFATDESTPPDKANNTSLLSSIISLYHKVIILTHSLQFAFLSQVLLIYSTNPAANMIRYLQKIVSIT